LEKERPSQQATSGSLFGRVQKKILFIISFKDRPFNINLFPFFVYFDSFLSHVKQFLSPPVNRLVASLCNNKDCLHPAFHH